MIRYAISREELERRIEEAVPGWLDDAKARTERLRALGCYEEKSSNWSKVKPLFMQLQGESKCAFCERKLESVAHGRGEQDVEHFRPKGRVKGWKPPQALAKLGVSPTPPAAEGGYHLLAYHLFNYAAACKPCNSGLKRDYFPIAGAYQLAGEEPGAMGGEQPYLIYPIGDIDQDPEALIQFHGISPQVAPHATGHDRLRALVTIEFFQLDDRSRRKNLLRDRATLLLALHPQLKDRSDAEIPAARRAKAEALVSAYTADDAPHASCARSFARLFLQDPAQAQRIVEAAEQYILSVSR